MTVRTIGKFGFLLAIMGFFMPIACDMNAFQLINYIDTPSIILIIGLFALSIIGFIIGLLLLMKKNIPIAFDWIVLLASICMGIFLLSMNELYLQYGAYVIISGFYVALIFQLISIFAGIALSQKKQLLISAIIGCSIILISLIAISIIISDILFIRLILLRIPMLCGIIAIVFNFIDWAYNKKIFSLIAGLLYGASVIFGIIELYFVLILLNNNIAPIHILSNMNVFFIIPAIISIMVGIMNIKKK
jgi:hypothetical protein